MTRKEHERIGDGPFLKYGFVTIEGVKRVIWQEYKPHHFTKWFVVYVRVEDGI